MKRPAKVRILGKPFSIVFTNGEPLSEDDMGHCDVDKQLIAVRDGQPLESEQDCLLHEVIHAISDSMGANMREAQVEKLATGLLAVLKDSPGFTSYLKRKT